MQLFMKCLFKAIEEQKKAFQVAGGTITMKLGGAFILLCLYIIFYASRTGNYWTCGMRYKASVENLLITSTYMCTRHKMAFTVDITDIP